MHERSRRTMLLVAGAAAAACLAGCSAVGGPTTAVVAGGDPGERQGPEAASAAPAATLPAPPTMSPASPDAAQPPAAESSPPATGLPLADGDVNVRPYALPAGGTPTASGPDATPPGQPQTLSVPGASSAPGVPPASTPVATVTGTPGESAGAVRARSAVRSASAGTRRGTTTEAVAEAEVVRQVNAERLKVGCQAVTVRPELVAVARAHSREMAAPGGFKHNGRDGRTPFQRMEAAGYNYAVAAENIAAGQPTAESVMAAWMASPAHRATILDCRFTGIGVGMVRTAGSEYGTYWTQDFGAPL